MPPRSALSCASVLPALLLALPPSRPADPAGRATASPTTAPPPSGARPGSHLYVAAGGQNAGKCPCVQVDPAHVRLVDPVVDGVFFRDLPCRPVSRRRGPVARRQAGAPPRLRPAARLPLSRGASPCGSSHSRRPRTQNQIVRRGAGQIAQLPPSSMTTSLGSDRQLRAAFCCVSAPAAAGAAGPAGHVCGALGLGLLAHAPSRRWGIACGTGQF